MSSLLRIKDLSIDFITESGTSKALENVSITINKGEIVALVGESGSGKSITALSVLQLLPQPPAIYRSGEITFYDELISKEPVNLLGQSSSFLQQVRGNRIGMIFQEPMTSLNPVLTCGSQVTEAIQLHKKISSRVAKEQTIKWFEKVKLPDPSNIYKRYPHQLSGGQKQRVMIAMAMCCDPSLLICDEPTTALDVTVQRTILDLIRELQKDSGMGVMFITHDLGVVARIADRAVVMYKGAIVEEGPVNKLFTEPQHPYTKALLACRPVNHTRGQRLPVVSDFMNVTDDKKLVDKTVSPINVISDEVLIRVEHVSVKYPSRRALFGKAIDFNTAVDDVSFAIYKGETVGLVGESGCGKTTLGRTLLRLIEPAEGKIWYKGELMNTMTASRMKDLRSEMQLIFQDPYSSLNPRMTIGSAIQETMKVHGLITSSKERKEKVIALLEKVGLQSQHYSRYPHEFSGGQRQRIVIARALSLNPSFLVCDESVSALDVSVQAQVLNLLNDLRKEFGFTVVFISHDLAVVRYISDRIMVMSKGRIVEEGLADEVYLHPQSPYTKKLIASIM